MMVSVMCEMVADRTGCLVVCSEYRLTPEHKLPAAFDDAITVARWVLANKTAIGGSDNSIVGVGGSSAGGSLSAAIPYEVQGIGF
jgi:acetyl esterase